MKYRCKDCGAVYEEKIEYCECGNNTFDILEPAAQKPLKSPADKGLIISWAFFGLCLLLSLIILFVIPNGGAKTPQAEPAAKTEIKKENIPDIDALWKDPVLPEPEPEPVETAPEPVVIIQKIIKRIETPVQTPPAAKPAAHKTEQPVQQSKPVVQSTPVQKPVSQAVQKPAAQSVQKPVIKEQPVKKEQPKVSKQLDSSVIKYRNILREVLLSKLNVGSISGRGTCVIQFSVDNTGKLINRKFAEYANNKSMNDAIYYMMMSVPKFQPPPPAYKGETFKIKFTIDNGAYEISFL